MNFITLQITIGFLHLGLSGLGMSTKPLFVRLVHNEESRYPVRMRSKKERRGEEAAEHHQPCDQQLSRHTRYSQRHQNSVPAPSASWLLCLNSEYKVKSTWRDSVMLL
mmetsp:Transcript_17705/g.40056  ORF Transcript_17705/g.40056 Transcript_17705/m.40056 type:complete len:108 (+) Transcript_17705:81-404(+)